MTDDFKGETINLINGIRSNQNKSYKSYLQVSFYGGSIIWGTGG